MGQYSFSIKKIGREGFFLRETFYTVGSVLGLSWDAGQCKYSSCLPGETLWAGVGLARRWPAGKDGGQNPRGREAA
jgi:hypothetical protein